MPTQSRNWCFTDFELLSWKEIYSENQDFIRYICVGKETCPKTKKIHYQGWIQLYNKKRIGGMKKLCASNKLHLEACRGSEYQNDKYCQKENTLLKLGTFIKQGARTDLEQLKKDIDANHSDKRLWDNHFQNMLRYHRSAMKYREVKLKSETHQFRKITTELIQGPTGIGKTRGVYEKECNLYKICGNDLNWWDGYEGEKTLLIDDYNNDVPITKMLNLLDGYQLRLPIKGGFTYANWDRIYITTNLHELHCNAKHEHKKALQRRITTVTNHFVC